MYNLIYPLYSSQAIISSTKAYLTLSSPTPQLCLITAKQSAIEIFELKSDSSTNSLFELSIFADILKIDTISNINNTLPDFVFLLTRNFKFSVGNITNKEVITNFIGNINSKFGEELPQKNHVFLHEQFLLPNKSIIKGYYGCYVYLDELRIIPYRINENGSIHINPVFTISLIEEFQYSIRDIVEFGISSSSNLNATKNEFLIGVLYVNNKKNDEKEDEPRNSIFKIIKFEDIEGEAKHPSMGEEWIVRFEEKIRKVIRIQEERGILAFSDKYIHYCFYDERKKNLRHEFRCNLGKYMRVPEREKLFILSDRKTGGLYYLALDLNQLQRIEIKYLGETPILSTMEYLHNKTLFVGSATDNSYVVKILENGDLSNGKSPYLAQTAIFYNLGSINSMGFLKRANNGDNIILASPCKQDSLNIFQKGSKSRFISSCATGKEEFPNKCFLLKNNKMGFYAYNNFLKVFDLSGEQMKRIENNEFIEKFNKRCVYICESEQFIYFVCDDSLYITKNGLNFVKQILLGGKCFMSHESSSYLCLVIQNSNLNLVITLLHMKTFEFSREIIINKQISSIFVNDRFLILSYWMDSQIEVYNLETLNIITLDVCAKKIDSIFEKNYLSIVSILLKNNYLFLGTTQGYVLIKKIDENFKIIQDNIISISERPVYIDYSQEENEVFVLGDRVYKVIVQEQSQKIEKIYMGIDEEVLKLGKIEQKYVVLLPFELKVVEFDSSQKFVILPFQMKDMEKDDESVLKAMFIEANEELIVVARNDILKKECDILIFDVSTKNFIEKIKTDKLETITQLQLENNYVIFTSIDDDLKNYVNFLHYSVKSHFKLFGKTHVVDDIKRVLMSEVIKGIKKYDDKHFVLYLGSFLCIYEFNGVSSKNILQEKFKKNLVMSIVHLDVTKKNIVLFDPFKGVNVYHYNCEENRLIFLAKSYGIQEIDHGCFYGNEQKVIYFSRRGNLGGSLSITQQKKKVDCDLDRINLQLLSNLNYAETVTHSLKGGDIDCTDFQNILEKYLRINFNLTKVIDESENFKLSPIYFSTQEGSINFISELPQTLFKVLFDLQESILSQMKGFFGFEYNQWRGYQDNLGNINKINIIDGKLLAQIIGYSAEKLEKILDNMGSCQKPKLAEILNLLVELERKIFY